MTCLAFALTSKSESFSIIWSNILVIVAKLLLRKSVASLFWILRFQNHYFRFLHEFLVLKSLTRNLQYNFSIFCFPSSYVLISFTIWPTVRVSKQQKSFWTLQLLIPHLATTVELKQWILCFIIRFLYLFHFLGHAVHNTINRNKKRDVGGLVKHKITTRSSWRSFNTQNQLQV